jgi:hypothetical protein
MLVNDALVAASTRHSANMCQGKLDWGPGTSEDDIKEMGEDPTEAEREDKDSEEEEEREEAEAADSEEEEEREAAEGAAGSTSRHLTFTIFSSFPEK